MPKKNYGKSLIYFAAITFLSACGGGGGGGTVDIAQINANAETAYTGNRNPALLNETNAMDFVQLVTGSVTTANDMAYQYRQSGNEWQGSNYLALNTELKSIAELAIEPQNRANRTTETGACPLGGQVTVVTDEAIGERIVTFTNCKIEGLTRNGIASVNILDNGADDGLSEYVMSFDDLSFTVNGIEETYLGTFRYKQDVASTGAFISSEVSNINITIKDTGAQAYLKNMRLSQDAHGPTASDPDYHNTLTGQVFIGTQGYVQVSSSDDFQARKNSFAPVDEGSILLAGASSSKAMIRSIYYYDGASDGGEVYSEFSRYRVDLDKDGDSTFELSSIQIRPDSYDYNGEPTGFQNFTNQPPVAVISDAEALSNSTYLSNWHLRENSSVSLKAFQSHDPDFDRIIYKWTVEERPTDSASQISSPESKSASFKLDVRGKYKLSLKVTDELGASSIVFLDLDSSDYPPQIFSNYNYPYGSGSERLDLFPLGHGEIFLAARAEDLEERSTHDYQMQWTFVIPTDSTLNMPDHIFNTNQDYSQVRFIPDVEGVYELTALATDSKGLQAQKTVAITVKNLAPIAVLDNYGFTKVGFEHRLRSKSYEPPNTFNAELTHAWEIVSSPAGSSVALVYEDTERENAYFTPDVAGNYRISLIVTDEYGLNSEKVYADVVITDD